MSRKVVLAAGGDCSQCQCKIFKRRQEEEPSEAFQKNIEAGSISVQFGTSMRSLRSLNAQYFKNIIYNHT